MNNGQSLSFKISDYLTKKEEDENSNEDTYLSDEDNAS